MESSPSPYEVRCGRCDVSFPVETRRCMHCGGPTARPGRGVHVETWTESTTEGAEAFMDPAEILSDQADRGDQTADGVVSIGRRLVRSLGGFLWIIVLIGFTLARNCGGE